MYYWNYKKSYLILTNKEEAEIVNSLSEKPIDSIKYQTDLKTRKRFERRINKFLKQEFKNNYEEFRKNYLFRKVVKQEAIFLFPLMLDAYGRLTKLATIGDYSETGIFESSLEDLIFIESPKEDLFCITFFRMKYNNFSVKPASKLLFNKNSIEKLVGTVDNFVLLTSRFHIKFTKNFIRIFVL